MGYLTTHVLDLARGAPARGLAVELWSLGGAAPRLLTAFATNDDGRADKPILADAAFRRGRYELRFAAGAYLRETGVTGDLLFLDEIPIRFGIDDESAHYHVPLLLSPYGYSTYRGS
jgi:5-hydroxyisourate hydrolase